MEETNLRLAENEVQVTGILTEKELNESMDKNNQPVIKGTVTIKTSDLNFVKINVYASKYTKDKRENPAFTGLQTVINEYKSVAEVGTEEATRLSVRKGQLQFRTFAGRDGNIVNAMQYSSNYFNTSSEYLQHLKLIDCKSGYFIHLFTAYILIELCQIFCSPVKTADQIDIVCTI